MRTFFVLICNLSFAWVAHGAGEKHTATSGGHPAGGGAPVQHVQTPHHAATSSGYPSDGGVPVQHAQTPHHAATSSGYPSGGGRRFEQTNRDTRTAATGQPPPAPVYHYNFPTKSGIIGRDFTRPLTPDEQSAIAREIEKGQPEGPQGAHSGYHYDNGVYHYNFPTKSGLIGRDFTTPLTPQEQATIGRQIANGEPEGIQAPPGGAPVSERVGAGAAAAREAEIEDAKKRGAIITDRTTKAAPPPAQGKVNPFRPQHFDLPKTPVPGVKNVNFQQGNHIPECEKWRDSRYNVFRNYTATWHDADWWRSHHSRIVFVLGGWYYWHAGYWYPAWGYSSEAVYPYDGPIYAFNDLDPDQAVANVQATLRELGYYHGPINGLLDYATRVAIANYQHDHGLYATSAMDEPTLAALGMA